MEEIGKVLPSVFKRQLRREDGHVVEILASLWPRVAGRPMARHSRPIAFGGGTLTLESDCPSWAAQLRGLQDEIREEVNGFLGAPVVRRLLVRYAPKPSSPEWDPDGNEEAV